MRDHTSAPPWRAHALPFAAALIIFLGYADLARGGLTIAPVLLTIGYVVFIPLALVRS